MLHAHTSSIPIFSLLTLFLSSFPDQPYHSYSNIPNCNQPSQASVIENRLKPSHRQQEPKFGTQFSAKWLSAFSQGDRRHSEDAQNHRGRSGNYGTRKIHIATYSVNTTTLTYKNSFKSWTVPNSSMGRTPDYSWVGEYILFQRKWARLDWRCTICNTQKNNIIYLESIR